MTAHKRDDGIKRRDFINGMLIAAGTASVGGSIPMRAFAQLAPSTTFPCDSAIGTDPNVTRGGNLRSVFNIAHWLRDNRLTFKTSSVVLSPSPCDSYQGSQPILADNGNYDVIIVGAGMSGCSAAFYITQQRPGTRILILDGQVTPGGNANRDDTAPIPDVASTATAYAVQPYAIFLNNIYNTTGILWQSYVVPSPFYSYFFDSATPYVNPGTSSWNIDTYGKGLDSVPYPTQIVNDLKSARADLMNWYHKPGAPAGVLILIVTSSLCTSIAGDTAWSTRNQDGHFQRPSLDPTAKSHACLRRVFMRVNRSAASPLAHRTWSPVPQTKAPLAPGCARAAKFCHCSDAGSTLQKIAIRVTPRESRTMR